MLLSQVIRATAITGRTDAVGDRLLGRQGGRWAHQWIDGAFPEAAARTHATPGGPPPAVLARSGGRPAAPPSLEDLHARGLLTDDQYERARRARAT